MMLRLIVLLLLASSAYADRLPEVPASEPISNQRYFTVPTADGVGIYDPNGELICHNLGADTASTSDGEILLFNEVSEDALCSSGYCNHIARECVEARKALDAHLAQGYLTGRGFSGLPRLPGEKTFERLSQNLPYSRGPKYELPGLIRAGAATRATLAKAFEDPHFRAELKRQPLSLSGALLYELSKFHQFGGTTASALAYPVAGYLDGTLPDTYEEAEAAVLQESIVNFALAGVFGKVLHVGKNFIWKHHEFFNQEVTSAVSKLAQRVRGRATGAGSAVSNYSNQYSLNSLAKGAIRKFAQISDLTGQVLTAPFKMLTPGMMDTGMMNLGKSPSYEWRRINSFAPAPFRKDIFRDEKGLWRLKGLYIHKNAISLDPGKVARIAADYAERYKEMTGKSAYESVQRIRDLWKSVVPSDPQTHWGSYVIVRGNGSGYAFPGDPGRAAKHGLLAHTLRRYFANSDPPFDPDNGIAFAGEYRIKFRGRMAWLVLDAASGTFTRKLPAYLQEYLLHKEVIPSVRFDLFVNGLQPRRLLPGKFRIGDVIPAEAVR